VLASGIYLWTDSGQWSEIVRSRVAMPFPGLGKRRQNLNPVPLQERLAEKGFTLGQPLLIRAFKQESEMEIWLKRGDIYDLFNTYPICTWSGVLGPKLAEGDGQSPEGFYFASRRQLKPDSKYYRAINVGFPNAYDESHGRTGSFIMIHGSCVSIGCYAMTDAGIDDIYQLAEAALNKNQEDIPIHVFPFRMTADNLSSHSENISAAFWQNLAEGDVLFQQTRKSPAVAVCDGRYVFAETPAQLPMSSNCKSITAWK
jgi:murein L,D-transpeptidase YafK